MSRINGTISALLLVVFSVGAAAATATIECSYSKYSDRDGLHNSEHPFLLTFLMDDKTSKSYLIGNNGSSEVERVANEGGVTFIETTATGNVMVTVIALGGESVHSRGGIMFGKILPAQFYGQCVAK